MTRTDIHRPSAIEPTDYEFVAFSYLRVDDLGSAQFLVDERRRLSAHMDRTGGTYSGHEHGGTCHICGSANAIYTAVFFHAKSNSYVKTGLDCADKLECSGIEAFRKNVDNARANRAGKAKAEAVLTDAGLAKAWEIYTNAVTDADGRDHKTVRDIVGKLVQYGSLSDKQIAFLRRLVDAIVRRPEIEARRAAEREAAKPVPVTTKRTTVRGKVLSIKVPGRDDFGPVRMLVQHEDGWKVFGSVPSNILADLNRGDTVQFDAAVKVSDKDDRFGYFSRPTKAERVGSTVTTETQRDFVSEGYEYDNIQEVLNRMSETELQSDMAHRLMDRAAAIRAKRVA